MFQQELAGQSNGWGIHGFSAFDQTFNSKPDSVTEATSPRSVPGTIAPLNALQKSTTLVNAVLNIVHSVLGEHFPKVDESGQCGHTTLYVGVIDHDITEDFAGIQLFVPTPSTIVFIGGPT
jgi:hypothetical protein